MWFQQNNATSNTSQGGEGEVLNNMTQIQPLQELSTVAVAPPHWEKLQLQ